MQKHFSWLKELLRGGPSVRRLIASNISAEQFIGMSGEGFFLGIAVAAYEWIAAIALIIVAVWFIPVYLKNHIYTMPQFLKTRYNESVALIMAVFWFSYMFS